MRRAKQKATRSRLSFVPIFCVVEYVQLLKKGDTRRSQNVASRQVCKPPKMFVAEMSMATIIGVQRAKQRAEQRAKQRAEQRASNLSGVQKASD